MAFTTPTSELEAVNTLLSTVGESPISQLETTGLADVSVARNFLDVTSRAVQARGWHFNTERDYPLTPNVDNEIVLPANTMSVSPSSLSAYRNLTQRGSRLYDITNRTYTITDKVYVNLVLLLPFTELPEAARWYITVSSARRFQAHILGSETIFKFSEYDENLALAAFLDDEARRANLNILTSDPGRSILDRY